MDAGLKERAAHAQLKGPASARSCDARVTRVEHRRPNAAAGWPGAQ